MTANESCRAGAPQRPVRGASREGLFSTDGRTIFYYRQKTDFDLRTLRYAAVLDCPLWEDVAAWDRRDVYVLEPQSCGGENCGGDYTGYGWGGLGVRAPGAFHWLPGGYGVDKRFVYNRWHTGPLEGARPERFEVLLCGGEEGFVVGRDGGRLFRDGELAAEREAFDPDWHAAKPRPRM
jgi:hypothetical protein